MVRESVYVITRPLSSIFESSWELKEVPETWKTSVFKKGNYRELQCGQPDHNLLKGANNPGSYFQIY